MTWTFVRIRTKTWHGKWVTIQMIRRRKREMASIIPSAVAAEHQHTYVNAHSKFLSYPVGMWINIYYNVMRESTERCCLKLCMHRLWWVFRAYICMTIFMHFHYSTHWQNMYMLSSKLNLFMKRHIFVHEHTQNIYIPFLKAQCCTHT